jgi:hypothetical protein
MQEREHWPFHIVLFRVAGICRSLVSCTPFFASLFRFTSVIILDDVMRYELVRRWSAGHAARGEGNAVLFGLI